MTGLTLFLGCLLVVACFTGLAILAGPAPRLRPIAPPPPPPPQMYGPPVMLNAQAHVNRPSARLLAYKAQLRREIRLEALRQDEERAWLEELKVIEWSVKTHYPDAIKAELYAICHRDRRPS